MEDLKDDPRIIGQWNDAVRIGWYGGKEGDHGTGRLHSFRTNIIYSVSFNCVVHPARIHSGKSPTSDTIRKFYHLPRPSSVRPTECWK